MSFFDVLFASALTGVFAGGCSTIGTYFTNKLVIKHLDQLENKIKKAKVVK